MEQDLGADAEVGEIRVGDNHLPADPEGFPDNFRRSDQFLKCAEEQDVIKRVLAVLVEAVGDVTLVDDKAAFDAAPDQCGILFDTFPGDLPGLNEALEERAVAGAEVKHTRALRNPLDNCVVNAGIHG